MTETGPAPDWAAHTPQRRPWRQRVARGPRADRQLREITVSLPPFIRDLDYVVERPLATMMTDTAGDLVHLDLTHGRRLGALNQLLLRTESVASSKIENIESSMNDYGRALLGVGANASAASMASATEALARMIRDADRTGLVRPEAIRNAHHDLFRRHPEESRRAGRFREVQSWIGGSDYSPNNALFVPPPPETVAAYLDDLFAFANRDDLPVFVQAAIAHAQFESIHPFIDGNGRIGRTLIHAVLRRRKATRHLTVPIASALVAHRDRYFDALDDYRNGHAYTLIAVLTSATRVATAESRRTATNLQLIRDEWHETAGDVRPGTTLHRLLDMIPADPIINVSRVAERFDVSASTARATIGRLEDAGVLTRLARTRRSPVWGAQDVLDEVADLNGRIHAVSRRQRP